MNHNKSFSAILQELSNNYYNHRISFTQYRTQRRRVLDSIDQSYNISHSKTAGSGLKGNVLNDGNALRDNSSGAEPPKFLGNTATFSAQDVQKINDATQDKNS